MDNTAIHNFEKTPTLWGNNKSESIDSTNVTNIDPNILTFDPNKKRKGTTYTNKTPYISGTDQTGLIPEELLIHLRKAMELTESLSISVKSSNIVAYDVSREEFENKLKEAKESMHKIQTRLTYFKYYSLIWSFCALLLGFFFAAGISGLLGPFSSITGILMSCAGIIGGVMDWRDRVKKNHV